VITAIVWRGLVDTFRVDSRSDGVWTLDGSTNSRMDSGTPVSIPVQQQSQIPGMLIS
jgi:hypothetical protein